MAASNNLPVYTQEFNIGLVGCDAIGTEAAATMVSASAAQALELGMPQFGYFRLDCASVYDCLVNSEGDSGSPAALLYTHLFTHMDIATIRNVTLSAAANPETYAAEGSDNATTSSLLFSNAATSGSENISLNGVSPSNWTGEVYTENTAGSVSQATYVPGMTITLPAESSVVVQMWAGSSPPAPRSYRVSFQESGLTSGLNWSVTLNGTPSLVVDECHRILGKER